jgi:Cellulase (glycosyl hydrolase family 5)
LSETRNCRYETGVHRNPPFHTVFEIPMLRARRIMLACLTLLCLGAAAAVPAQAFEIGIQDDDVFVAGSLYDRARALEQAQALGVGWVRAEMPYGYYRKVGFKPYDDLVTAAAARGMRVELTIEGTARYSGGSRYIGYYKPKAGRFGTWAKAVARHFRGRIFRYSIWNEPNLGQFLSPNGQAPRLYRRLYDAGYKAIKSVDGRNQVFIGEFAAQQRIESWVSRMGKGVKTDGIAYHPYQFFKAPGAPDRRFLGVSNTKKIKAIFRRLARKKVLRSRSGGVPPIFYTEFSYPLGRPYPTPESTRVNWIPRAFLYVKRFGIKQMAYYKLVLRAPGSNWNSGLVEPTGATTPAYRALLAIRPRLIGR